MSTSTVSGQETLLESTTGPIGVIVGPQGAESRLETPSAVPGGGFRLFTAASVSQAKSLYRPDDVSLVVVNRIERRDQLADVVNAADSAFPDSGIVVVSETPRLYEYVTAHLAGADLYVAPDAFDQVVKEWLPRWRTQRHEHNILVDDIIEAVLLNWRTRRPERGSTVAEGFDDIVVEQAIAQLRPQLSHRASRFDTAHAISLAMKTAASTFGFKDEPIEPATSALQRLMIERYRGNLVDAIESVADRSFLSSVKAEIDSSSGGGPPVMTEQQPAETSTIAPDPQLFWNTRFPDHPEILQAEPHRVTERTEYGLESVIESAHDPSAVTRSVPSDRLRGKKIVFQMDAENGEFRHPNAETWDTVAISPKLVCSDRGTDAFRVTYRPKQKGEAIIEIFLIVDNSIVERMRIELTVGADSIETQRATDVQTAASHPLNLAAASDPPGADYRLHLSREEAKLFIDTLLVARVEVDDNLAAQIGFVASKAYDELRAVSIASPPSRAGADPFMMEKPDFALLRLAQIGAALHRLLFLQPLKGPPREGMKRLSELLRAAGSSVDPPQLQIDALKYPLPWGLLYDRSATGELPKLAKDVDPDGFWGRRFDIYRSVETDNRNPKRGSRRWLKPVIGAYVPRSDDQRVFVESLRKAADNTSLVVIADSSSADDLSPWVKSGEDSDLLYFFCHARPAQVSNPLTATGSAEDSVIGFGAGDQAPDKVTLAQLKGWWDGRRETNPVVFFNACSSGQNDMIYGAPFVDFFTGEWKAQAFVGTDWPVNAAFADTVGQHVLKELLQNGLSLRAALRTVGNKAAESGNYFTLMYAVYGPNNVQFVEPVSAT